MRLFDISHTISWNVIKLRFFPKVGARNQTFLSKWKLDKTTLSVSARVQFYYLLEFTIKTHLSAVVNCRIVNNRHVDYRFYATTSGFFHRSLDLLHYTWYWRLHYRQPLQATQAEFYLLLANRSTAGVRARGETRWLLCANPRRCELTWSR